MPDPTTPAKGLTQPLVGGDNNEWGYLLNTDLALIDTALGGTLSLSISGNTTLNSTQLENSGYEFTGTLSGTATITWPSFYGLAAIQNGTTGGHSISCGIEGGTFVSIPNGSTYGIWSDGTNFAELSGVGATTGSGPVVLENSPTIGSPTFTGTVSGAGTIPNSVLVDDSITIAGHTVALGGSQNLAASDLTNGTTGSGDVVLATSPTIASPTFTGTVSGLSAGEIAGLAAVATSGSASDLTTGTLPNARLSAVPNSALADSSITIAGHSISLGSTQALAASDLTNGTTGSGEIVLQTSPALAGSPTGPTASIGTNTIQLATAAFVQANQLGINVMAFGATGNGSTDDASAINSAISSLGSTGGIVFFPPSIYIVGSSITLPSNVALIGSGRGATIIRAKASTTVNIIETTGFSSLTGTNSTGGPYKFALRSLSVDGNKSNGSTGNGVTIYGIDFNVDDVEIYNCSNVCLYSEWGLSGTVPTPNGDSMEAHIHGLKTYGAGLDGIQWFGPHDSTMDDTQTFLNARYGLYVQTTTTYAGAGLQASNFHSYGNTSHGVLVDAIVYFVNFESESNDGDGIHIVDTSFSNFDGKGIIVYNNAGDGLNITTTFANIAGIQAFNNTGSGIVSAGAATMTDVLTFSNGQLGLWSTSDSDVYSGVRSFSNGSHGVQIDVAGTLTGVYTYLNAGDGLVLNTNDVIATGVNAQQNTGTGIKINGGFAGICLAGHAVGNATQLDLGTVAPPGIIDVTVFNASGQTSYTGTPGDVFLRVASAGVDGLPPLNQVQT